MLENHKAAFSNLLIKIDTIGLAAPSYRNDVLEAEFNEIEKEYQKIRRAIFTRLEEQKIASDTLNQQCDCKSIERHNDDLLKLAADKLITEDCANLPFEMQEIMIPFYLIKGDFFFREGRFDVALDSLEEILKVNPGNLYVHSKLVEIGRTAQRMRKRAEKLQEKYRFKYIGSFGSGILKHPVYILASECDNSIFVSDNKNHKIYKFHISGEYLGDLPVEVNSPMGLFMDDHDNLWICDFGKSCLLAVDSNGEMMDEILFKDILYDALESFHPYLGCLNKDRFYLILIDSNRQKAILVSFNRYDPRATLEVLYIPACLYSEIQFIEDKLFVVQNNPYGVYLFDFDRKDFARFGDHYSTKLWRLLKIDDRKVFAGGELLLKISSDGKQIYAANLRKIFHCRSQTSGLASVIDNDLTILFIADNVQKTIHKFVI